MTTKFAALFTLFTISFYSTLMAQKKIAYESSWQKVDALMLKGLPKSALEEVDKIYAQAKKENAAAQQIKSLVYKSQLIQQVEENDWYKNVQAFEKETAIAKEPARQILHSISADLYYNYFQAQRWKIYNRSATVNFVKDDPETWSKEDFHKIISTHYEASLLNTALLQQTKLDIYDPVIVKGNQRTLRPTLYDLLAHKALDYYKTGEIEITKPAYAFELNDMANLATAKIFIRYDYSSKDSSSSKLATIKLFQDLIRFHADDKDKAALVDVDIERIEYAHSNSVNEGKEQLYKEALEQVYSQYPTVPEAMEAGYLLAVLWQQKGNAYQPGIGTEMDKNALKEALMIAKEVAKKFPASEGSIHAANLVNDLQRPELDMQVEKVNTLNEPFRSLVKYKNINTIYLRLILVTDAIEKELNDNRDYTPDAYWKKLVGFDAIKSWQQSLPVMDDLRQHSTEIKIDQLPVGKYILLSSKNDDFNTGDNTMASAILYVSNISFVNSGMQYFLLDRISGKPLAGAAVQQWFSTYDYRSRKYVVKKGALLKADKNGFVELPEAVKENNQASMQLEMNYKKDHLYLADNINYNRYYNNITTTTGKTDWDIARYFIFTDRSIYRPGQTLYFKAIGIVPHAADAFNNSGNSLFLPDKPVTIELINANGEIADTMQLTPNEYGSINGNFKLPETGLTGNFQLHVKIPQYSSASFNVEEYKRPKFYVEYDTLKDSYQLNDSIKITGTAKAYAGNNIDGAAVKYRVHRATRFLYPWLFWRSSKMIWPPSGRDEDMEITHGETTTDAAGKFTVTFKAIPDLSTNKALDPSFDYTIEADITDLNGETRSASNRISIGYKSLLVNITVPGGEHQLIDSFKSIQISTTNLSGTPVPAWVKINIYQLKTPDRLIRERYWEQPDTTAMSYAEFIKYFPHDEYRDEADHRSWEKGKLILTDSFKTGGDPNVKIDRDKFSTGWYMMELIAKDKDGQEVKALEYVALNDPAKNQFAAPGYHIQQVIKATVEPGEDAVFIQGTAAGDLFVIEQTIKKPGDAENTNSAFDYQQLDHQFSTLRFATTEADRGGYSVNRFFIKDNRFYMANWMIDVPWTNKELKISFETFRDKLLPGQEEKWKVKISGYKGDAVAAEMLASMYDASLDQFSTHAWNGLNLWNRNQFYNSWDDRYNFSSVEGTSQVWQDYKTKDFDKRYDALMAVSRYGGMLQRLQGRVNGVEIYGSHAASQDMMLAAAPMADSQLSEVVTVGYGTKRKVEITKFTPPKVVKDEEVKEDEIAENAAPNKPDNSAIQIRKNFNETAFFFPDLHTNDKGEIEFSFTMPEALTQWKLQTLAHTKNLSTALATKSIVTQKELMVQPNAPRFFRQGDSLVLVSKLVNLSDKILNGQVQLQLINAATLESVDGLFNNKIPVQNFSIAAGQSSSVSFPVTVPMGYTDPLMYRIVAKAGDISDGEEMALPVLTNRMLVTESFSINLRGTNNKSFNWDKLLQSGKDKTLQNQSITVEYTSNPAWYSVQALPYLMEYPYDCAEQTWNRFYANALSGKIANSTPKIKAIFEQWKNTDTAALLSNLQKNQELKAVLLEETPWVLQAKTEAEQKRNIGLLFDMVRMSNEADKALSKLKEMQSSNGGFVWFKGGPDDRYMTQYIVTGIGHLQKLNAWPAAQTNMLNDIVTKALPYLDARLKEDYDNLVRNKVKLKENNLSSIAVQYLYMRSFFTEKNIVPASKKAYDYYTSQVKQYWLTQSKYSQGMIALALNRMKDATTAKNILKSLTENSISNEEFGMYWKEFNTGGYYWWQAPIESHALLIEAFSEIENNNAKVDALKTWLLKQKQTQNWGSTKATADACYALLLQGNNWLNAEQVVTIKLGNKIISADKTEAGTGYFKQTIAGENVTPSMGNINVKVDAKNQSPNQPTTSWGSVYWQYFQDLDKITTAATPMSLKKQLFIQRNGDRGPVITPITDNDLLKVGDPVKVRIELRTDRNLEYVHLKDMRASCFEPVNVLSSYKYQDGLGYYEATKDASTNFFISYLNKGTYIFEYDLLVTHTGNFSNGISSIQCMYAPEFSAHSEGVRVTVTVK